MRRDPFYQPPIAMWDPVRVARGHHECFADEVTVGFPPVAPLVERERDTFLGAAVEPDALATEVCLSAGDAARGTVVPLEVPLRGTCPGCGGRGETWPEPCRACSGTGEAPIQHRVLLSLPAGVSDGTRFRFRVRARHAPPVRIEVRVAVRRPAA